MREHFKVLVIDDDRITLHLLHQALSRLNFDVHCELSAENAILHISDINPDIIVTDYHLKLLNGVELCKILRKSAKWYYIILVTADTDIDILNAAFEAGVNDFIKKPINDHELHGRLTNATHIINRITHYQRANDELSKYTSYLEEQANSFYQELITDALTNIYNRRYAENILSRYWNSFVRDKIPFSIISMDIDNFKKVNDNHGHDVGDIVLKHVAAVISANVRVTDTFARFGGEEFVVICNEINPTSLLSLCEKLRIALEHNQPSIPNLATVTISLGGAISDISSDSSWNDTYKRSDLAMYASKNTGKNRTTIYE